MKTIFHAVGAIFIAAIATAPAGAVTSESVAPATASPSPNQALYDKAVHDQDETHQKNMRLMDRTEKAMDRQETHMARYEKMMDRQEADFARFEKILDTWERQQAEYQKYLDALLHK